MSALPDDMSPEYGETEVKHLCAKFGLSFKDVKLAHRENWDSHDASSSTKLLRRCSTVVSTIPVNTAACEK